MTILTFCEAYAIFGRDSAAIADACGIPESEAYNLMAARADRDRGIMPTRSAASASVKPTAVGARGTRPSMPSFGGRRG